MLCCNTEDSVITLVAIQVTVVNMFLYVTSGIWYRI